MLEKPEYQCKTVTVHSSENRVDPNQLITNAKICLYHMRAYESIILQMYAHAALTLFYKRLFFFQSFFFKFYLFQKQISDIRSTICLDPIKNPVVVPDLGPFCFGEKSPDDINHLTQPHSMGSNTACWFIDKYGLSNAISEDPNEVPEFCGVS